MLRKVYDLPMAEPGPLLGENEGERPTGLDVVLIAAKSA